MRPSADVASRQSSFRVSVLLLLLLSLLFLLMLLVSARGEEGRGDVGGDEGGDMGGDDSPVVAVCRQVK